MRLAYAHDALLILPPGADERAPGGVLAGAIGAPLHTAATRDGEQLRLRVLFAASPDRVDEIRSRIDAALAAGAWQVASSGCARVDRDEHDHARRLLKSS
jgi:hypothetical protein